MTITGTPEAQWKSQYYIYDKIRQEGWIIFSLSLSKILLHTGYAGDDEVRLRAEIYVPTALIGRLVGKGGHNVRVNNEERERKRIEIFFDSHSGSSIAAIHRCNYQIT